MDRRLRAQWAVVAATFGWLAVTAVAQSPPQPPTATGPIAFTPPAPETIPDTPLGDMIRFGRDVFVDTQRYAKPYVGNGLNCVNCHLDEGRQPNAAPLWAAYVTYPAFRSEDRQVASFALRLEDCFRFSMNGRAPPPNSGVIVGLISYAYWLATGAPTGAQLAGRGYPPVAAPALPPDRARGSRVYTERCAACHGPQGQGIRAEGRYTFPPLWGRDSYNAGAGMHNNEIAAAFIKAKMPLGQGGTLTEQQAWDVAAFVNDHPRPPDPRQKTANRK